MNLISIKGIDLKLASVLVLITCVGLLTVGDHGLSMDEANHVLMLRWNWELIQQGKEIPGDSHFHGIVFNSIAEIFFQIKHLIIHQSFAPLLDASIPSEEILSYDRYLSKHTFTFLISLITYLSVAGGVRLLYGKQWAWLAPLVLVLLPRFWGHSFFNPKDVPFAALFTLCTCWGAFIITGIRNETSLKNIGQIRKNIIPTIAYGILVGLLSGIRLGGFMSLAFFALVALVLIPRRNFIRTLGLYIIHFGVMGLSWGITLFLVSPASWSNPFQWFWDAIQYFSQHEWPGTVLFKGEYIKGSELPWDYLPTCFLITTPAITLIYFLIGLVALFKLFSHFNETQKAYSLLILLQIFTLPMIAIIKGSTLYDVLRHFLFVLPGIAVVATVGLVWSYQQISRSFPKFKLALISVTLISAFFIAFDMVTLHPYEYIYFNRLSGGLKAAQTQHETEYWALSMREGMEWLNEKGVRKAVVSAPGIPWLLKPFADSHFTVTHHEDWDAIESSPTDIHYYLAPPRWDWQTIFFPDCDVIHTIARQGVPLTRIKECQRDR